MDTPEKAVSAQEGVAPKTKGGTQKDMTNRGKRLLSPESLTSEAKNRKKSILKLITDPGFLNQCKTWTVRLKGWLTFLISQGEGEMLQKAKNLQANEKKSFLLVATYPEKQNATSTALGSTRNYDPRISNHQLNFHSCVRGQKKAFSDKQRLRNYTIYVLFWKKLFKEVLRKRNKNKKWEAMEYKKPFAVSRDQ